MNDDELLRELRGAARRRDEAPTATSLDAPLGPAFEQALAARLQREVRPKAPRRARAFVLGPLAAFAAAAALFLWLRPAPRGASVDLPAYELSVTGGQDEVRAGGSSGATTSVTGRADAPFTALLRPTVASPGGRSVRVFVVRDGRAREATATVRVSDTGSVEVRGRLGGLVGDAPGDATLVVTVAGTGSTFDGEALALGSASPRADVRVARVDVHVLP